MMTENPRNEKGIQILSKGNHITKLGKNHYRVESQTQDKSYHVRKLQDADIWECTCGDFIFNLRKGNNDKRCKHILACIMLQKTVQQEKKIEKIDQPKVCPKCQSTTYRKHGFRKMKNGTKRQRYDCMQCNHKFTLNDGSVKSPSEIFSVKNRLVQLILIREYLSKIMPHVDSLKACKKCKNVYTDTIGNVRHSPTKCPVCGETNNEPVYSD